MDPVDKARFEGLEARYDSLEKRFEDLKWYFGGVVAVVTAGIAVYSILIGFNFNSEKTSLEDFKKEIREDIARFENRVEKPAKLEIWDVGGNAPVEGKEIPATIDVDEKGVRWLSFSTSLRNSGGGPSGDIVVKLYSTKEIQLPAGATDEHDAFQYEGYLPAATIVPTNLQPKYSSAYAWVVNVKNVVAPGRYLILMKLFYGNGKVDVARFYIRITK